eukprot:gnl/TRDRNA2_/TRDRNA2_161352_c0_seq1.p1 gnl/TRDRNA2_/TRDRNA2_161352_c0~~gnl/TRDRNA2_/TRDRNA2_161352_c0_seq1.p1  ORF type:complete len:202 (+),score=4.48 gnl/TRDRNA2_/TRDRNA2_161352_c0_seq1:48-608(+)
MSRSLGDLDAHSIGLSCMPEINTLHYETGGTLVICSDGVWDMMRPEEVAQHVASAEPAVGVHRDSASRDARLEAIAHSLVYKARARWPLQCPGHIDDVTAVIVEASPMHEASPVTPVEATYPLATHSPATLPRDALSRNSSSPKVLQGTHTSTGYAPLGSSAYKFPMGPRMYAQLPPRSYDVIMGA